MFHTRPTLLAPNSDSKEPSTTQRHLTSDKSPESFPSSVWIVSETKRPSRIVCFQRGECVGILKERELSVRSHLESVNSTNMTNCKLWHIDKLGDFWYETNRQIWLLIECNKLTKYHLECDNSTNVSNYEMWHIDKSVKSTNWQMDK